MPLAVILLGENAAVTSSVNGMQSFLEHLPRGLLPAGLTERQAVGRGPSSPGMAGTPRRTVLPSLVGPFAGHLSGG